MCCTVESAKVNIKSLADPKDKFRYLSGEVVSVLASSDNMRVFVVTKTTVF